MYLTDAYKYIPLLLPRLVCMHSVGKRVSQLLSNTEYKMFEITCVDYNHKEEYFCYKTTLARYAFIFTIPSLKLRFYFDL